MSNLRRGIPALLLGLLLIYLGASVVHPMLNHSRDCRITSNITSRECPRRYGGTSLILHFTVNDHIPAFVDCGTIEKGVTCENAKCKHKLVKYNVYKCFWVDDKTKEVKIDWYVDQVDRLAGPSVSVIGMFFAVWSALLLFPLRARKEIAEAIAQP